MRVHLGGALNTPDDQVLSASMPQAPLEAHRSRVRAVNGTEAGEIRTGDGVP